MRVLIEQGFVKALDKAVGLRPADPGGAVLDAFHLQKQFVGMAFRASAEFAAVVREHGGDASLVLIEGWQNAFVEHMYGRDRHFAGVQAPPGVA